MAVLAKASEKRPSDRYRSALEMASAVDHLLAMAPSIPDRIPPASKPAAAPLENSVAALETQLAHASVKADSSTQLAALRGLYGLYSRLDRREDATKVFREALVLHVRLHTPLPAARKA